MSAADILQQQLRVARRLWPSERSAEVDFYTQGIAKLRSEWESRNSPKAAVSFATAKKPRSGAKA